MSHKSILVISLVLSSVRMSFSQDSPTIISFEPQHLLTLSSGISSHAVRDEMISPLLYRGTQAPLALSYRFQGIENRHALLFYYDNSGLNSSITKTVNDEALSHYINNLYLNLEYSFSTKAAVFEDLNTTCFLGARLSSILNLRNHYFLQDKNHMSAEQMTGLGIHVLTEATIQQESNNFLRVEINIPCISYVLLTNRYNANVSEKFDNIDFEQSLLWQLFKKGDFVTFNRLFEVQADVSYIFFVSNHIAFDLQYRLLYYSFAQYQDLFRARVLNNQVLLGMTVKL
ncbi:MAG: hypothetical protein UX30_C0024G0008 [Candidatus Saccharibacteria bacterium GW2011_GWA2_46_10]|nr:MAG: hypothetical protein UX30_C0024G0008 [Candidatus Saccharibacteria bacterium GW2011_GWA2_46_10]HCM68156.1 hypothetical protein [Candidatus Kerfeldbacteria bacterium]